MSNFCDKIYKDLHAAENFLVYLICIPQCLILKHSNRRNRIKSSIKTGCLELLICYQQSTCIMCSGFMSQQHNSFPFFPSLSVPLTLIFVHSLKALQASSAFEWNKLLKIAPIFLYFYLCVYYTFFLILSISFLFTSSIN